MCNYKLMTQPISRAIVITALDLWVDKMLSDHNATKEEASHFLKINNFTELQKAVERLEYGQQRIDQMRTFTSTIRVAKENGAFSVNVPVGLIETVAHALMVYSENHLTTRLFQTVNEESVAELKECQHMLGELRGYISLRTGRLRF